jgi:hypothetical protein
VGFETGVRCYQIVGLKEDQKWSVFRYRRTLFIGGRSANVGVPDWVILIKVIEYLH